MPVDVSRHFFTRFLEINSSFTLDIAAVLLTKRCLTQCSVQMRLSSCLCALCFHRSETETTGICGGKRPDVLLMFHIRNVVTG